MERSPTYALGAKPTHSLRETQFIFFAERRTVANFSYRNRIAFPRKLLIEFRISRLVPRRSLVGIGLRRVRFSSDSLTSNLRVWAVCPLNVLQRRVQKTKLVPGRGAVYKRGEQRTKTCHRNKHVEVCSRYRSMFLFLAI